jgi:hypothetical protein
MRTLLYCIMVWLALPAYSLTAGTLAPQITSYDKFTAMTFGMEGVPGELVVLRSFRIDGRRVYLAVDTRTLKTSVISSSSLWTIEMSIEEIIKNLPDSVYAKALKKATANSTRIHNAGIAHVRTPENGAVLSIDLCPSKRDMDFSIFESVSQAFTGSSKPVPMAIALSGRWMEKHGDELAWMKKFIRENKISVTWINHSYTHRYRKTEPLRKNFMLFADTDVRHEILANEQLMLENGIIPSVLFRFPGLVSNKKLFDEIVEYGLITLGSDAWLAKKQRPVKGSIILVHANGKDPSGGRKLKELLEEKEIEILDGIWKLLDIRKCLAER